MTTPSASTEWMRPAAAMEMMSPAPASESGFGNRYQSVVSDASPSLPSLPRTGVRSGSRPNGRATALPLTPTAPAPPPVPAALLDAVWSVLSVLTELATPASDDSSSALRSPATPFGVKPTVPVPARAVAASPDSGCSSDAFGSVSSRTSLARPHGAPVTASTLERAREKAGYCATAPFAIDSTSNSTIAAAATVNGGIAHNRRRRTESARV